MGSIDGATPLIDHMNHLIRSLLVLSVLPMVGCAPLCDPGVPQELCVNPDTGMSRVCCGATCCPYTGTNFPSLRQLPVPDLSYASLDGVVDFGLSEMHVRTDDGDSFSAKVKGRVAIAGGQCLSGSCPLEIAYVDLAPHEPPASTTKGRSVSDVMFRNDNSWVGVREADGLLALDQASRAIVQGRIDGVMRMEILSATNAFVGYIHHDRVRLTDHGSQVNNLIEVSATFEGENATADIMLFVWVTSCAPSVHATAECVSNIEPGGPGMLRLDARFRQLGALQASQDLCDSLFFGDPAKACEAAAGDPEFPSFSCARVSPSASDDPYEEAKALDFEWVDSLGNLLGRAPLLFLDSTPPFPVTLSVTNRWGRTVSSTVTEAPEGTGCPPYRLVLYDDPHSPWREPSMASLRELLGGDDVPIRSKVFTPDRLATDQLLVAGVTSLDENRAWPVVHARAGGEVVELHADGGTSEGEVVSGVWLPLGDEASGTTWGRVGPNAVRMEGEGRWTCRPGEGGGVVVEIPERSAGAAVFFAAAHQPAGGSGILAIREVPGEAAAYLLRCLDPTGRPVDVDSYRFAMVAEEGGESGLFVLSVPGQRAENERSGLHYEVRLPSIQLWSRTHTAVAQPISSDAGPAFCTTRFRDGVLDITVHGASPGTVQGLSVAIQRKRHGP